MRTHARARAPPRPPASRLARSALPPLPTPRRPAVRVEYFNSRDDDSVLQLQWASPEKGIKREPLAGAYLQVARPADAKPAISYAQGAGCGAGPRRRRRRRWRG